MSQQRDMILWGSNQMTEGREVQINMSETNLRFCQLSESI